MSSFAGDVRYLPLAMVAGRGEKGHGKCERSHREAILRRILSGRKWESLNSGPEDREPVQVGLQDRDSASFGKQKGLLARRKLKDIIGTSTRK